MIICYPQTALGRSKELLIAGAHQEEAAGTRNAVKVAAHIVGLVFVRARVTPSPQLPLVPQLGIS